MSFPNAHDGGSLPGEPPSGVVPPEPAAAPEAPWPGAPEPAVTAWRHHVPLRMPRWGFGDAWIALLGAIVLSSVVGLLLLAVPAGSTGVNVVILLSLLAQWTAMAGWPWWITRRRGNGIRLDLGLAIRWSDVGWGLGGGVASLVVATAVASLTTMVFGDFSSAAGEMVTDFEKDRVLLAVLVLGIGLLAPVIEEICFRGMFWGSLAKRGVNPTWVTVWSALAFACFHLEPVRIPLLFCTGLVLGYLRQRTGRLGAPIVAHIVNNAAAALGIFFV